MKMNTKEAEKLSKINNQIHEHNGDVKAEVTKSRQHHMEGVGMQHEGLIRQMIANSVQESNIDPVILRQYSTVASKSGQKAENDQVMDALIKNKTPADQRK